MPTHGILQDVAHYLVIPLAVPCAIVLAAVCARLVRVLIFRIRQRGFPPIVIHAKATPEGDALAAGLSAYLVQDKLGTDIVIPPGGGPVQQAYPIENMPSPGWLAAVMRIVIATEPSFQVALSSVTFSRPGTNSHTCEATVRITKAPRNRLISSDVVRRDTLENLVHDIAVLVIHSVRQDPQVTLHTPRWEQWSSDIRAYSAYRTALQLERAGRATQEQALRQYDKAIRLDPANFMITTRKAALLELMRKPDLASGTYRTCKELWPEAIEVAYRLAASYSNNAARFAREQSPSSSEAAIAQYMQADEVLDEVIRRLGRVRLWRSWRRTWRHTPRNVGEARYWLSWLRRRPVVFGLSKRLAYVTAAKIAKNAHAVSRLCNGKQAGSDEVSRLLERMARLTTRGRGSAVDRLFQSPAGGTTISSSGRAAIDGADLDMRPAMRVKQKRRVGWLAHYNAAIFFSVALDLPKCYVPQDYLVVGGSADNRDVDRWKMDCARAAIRELAYAKRDPRNHLEPDWYRRDPGLAPLGRYMGEHGRNWGMFVGVALGE